MTEVDNDVKFMEEIKRMTSEGKIDAVVEKISIYLNLSIEENYIDRLENILEAVSSVHGGKTVIRFLIENSVIDVPTLLTNLSKRDNLLRYSVLLNLKPIVEEESDLFLPFYEELLIADDPNVREAYLQLLIFMAGGEKSIQNESIIEKITEKLNDEKDFVVEKSIQVLKAIGKNCPSIVTKILANYAKNNSENEDLKKRIDNILKSIVTVEKIEEIVEEEESEVKGSKKDLADKEKELESKETELIEKEKKLEVKEAELEYKEIISDFDVSKTDKERELKIKELELKKKELELQEKERKIQRETIEEMRNELQKKRDISEVKEDIEEELLINKQIAEEEELILNKERELRQKDLELKKKRLELEEKEKTLEEIEI
ncbi:MAG: hypothetical protein ACFFAO_17020, partial [Candidatus Hermodarchaeota archaeon]